MVPNYPFSRGEKVRMRGSNRPMPQNCLDLVRLGATGRLTPVERDSRTTCCASHLCSDFELWLDFPGRKVTARRSLALPEDEGLKMA